MKRPVKLFGVVLALLIIIVASGAIYYQIMLTRGPNGATYWYVSGIASKCYRANSKTEIEQIMEGKAPSHQIDPSESSWGHQYKLADGEYMIRYMVKNVEPIDIVYSKDERMVKVFESYE